jgi:hypothetical protein
MLGNTLPPSFLLLPPSTWGKSVGCKLSRQGILSPYSCMWQKGPGNAAGLVRLNQGFLTYGPILPSLRHYHPRMSKEAFCKRPGSFKLVWVRPNSLPKTSSLVKLSPLISSRYNLDMQNFGIQTPNWMNQKSISIILRSSSQGRTPI